MTEEEGIDAADGLRSRGLYKAELVLVKTIPALMAFASFMNTLLSYFNIDCFILSYIGGCSLQTLVFLYVSSYVFRFCAWHRMFIHYVTLNWVLNIIDYHIGIPVSDKGMFLIYMSITAITIFLFIYLKYGWSCILKK